MSLLFFLLRPRPLRSTLFPYTTLFRSRRDGDSIRARVDLNRHAFEIASLLISDLHRVNLDFVAIPALNLRSEEHTSELQSHSDLVCRLLLEKKKKRQTQKALTSY